MPVCANAGEFDRRSLATAGAECALALNQLNRNFPDFKLVNAQMLIIASALT